MAGVFLLDLLIISSRSCPSAPSTTHAYRESQDIYKHLICHVLRNISLSQLILVIIDLDAPPIDLDDALQLKECHFCASRVHVMRAQQPLRERRIFEKVLLCAIPTLFEREVKMDMRDAMRSQLSLALPAQLASALKLDEAAIDRVSLKYPIKLAAEASKFFNLSIL